MKLFLLAIIAVQLSHIASEYHNEDVLVTIKQINTRFSTRTNVFFNFDKIYQDIIPHLETPSLIMTRSENFQFIHAWNKDILAIALVTLNSTEAIQGTLSYVLHRMRHVNVLFVMLDSTNPYTIFDWAWTNGFKNSIALFWIEDKAQLAEFYPFPTLTWENIGSINESGLQKELTNFHRHPIRTPLADDPPSIFRYINRQGDHTFSGLYYKMFDLFINRYNATIQEVLLPDPYPFAFSVADYMHIVKRNEVDIGLYPLPTSLSNEYFLNTNPYYLVFHQLMVPFAKPVQQSMYVILPFQTPAWLGLATVIFIFAVGIHLATRRAAGHSDFDGAFLQALSGILNIGFPFKVYKSRVLLWIFGLLYITGIILSNMYLAHLSTFLTTPAHEHQMNSIEDVIASDLPITIESAKFEIMQMLGVSKEILAKVKVVNASNVLQLRRNLNCSSIGIVTKWKFQFFAHQQIYLREPLVKLIDKPVFNVAPAFIMPLTSPYIKLYSNFLQRCIEFGFYQKFNVELIDDGIVGGLIALMKPDETQIAALNLECFRVSWSLLAVGYTLGMVSFFVEVIYGRFKLCRLVKRLK